MLSTPYEELPPFVKQAAPEDPYPAVRTELVRRRDIPFLIDAYAGSSNPSTRYQVILMLYEIEDPAVLGAFRRWLSDSEDDTDYWIADYLARHGDSSALASLNRHYFKYPVSSVQWAYTVRLFGRFGYRPAIPNLVDSLNAASLNLTEAAFDALSLLYPDAPRKFESLEATQRYFQARCREENLQE